MKRIIILLTALVMCLLAACGEKEPAAPAGYPLDFRVDAAGSEAKILQITDTQVTDEGDAELKSKCFDYIDYAVRETKPDLILLTGDIVYGRYDKTGVIFEKITAHMESLGIKWAPVFGNHDNESPAGTDRQCEILENAQNCLFKRRSELGGNGNYSIGVFVGGKLVRTIYMLDTKGCTMIDGGSGAAPVGLSSSQLSFVAESQTKAADFAGKRVPAFAAMHIMPCFIATAVKTKYGVNVTDLDTYEIPENADGDFGSFGQKFSFELDRNGNAYYALKEAGVNGIFAGHEHLDDASVSYDGVRLTYGLKSSTCDAFDFNKLGGTLITVKADSFAVRHVYKPAE